MAKNDLIITIAGNVKDYVDKLDQATKKTEDLSDTLSTIGKGAGIVFAALTAEVGLSIAAFKEAQQVTNQLSQAMSQQGVFSNNLLQKYKDQATALQGLTGISDEAILKSTAIVQAYIGQRQVTDELTQAIADFATVQGIDLASAAEIVGKSIGTTSNALGRYGIEINENKSKTEKMAEVIDKLNAKFEGQAEAAGKGLGALNKLKESFGDLQESIGERFAPIVEALSNKLIGFFQSIQNNPAILDFIAGITAGGIALSAITAAIAGFGVALISANAAAIALGTSIGVMLPPLAILVIGLTAAATALGYFGLRQNITLSAAQKTQEKIADLTKELESLEKVGNRGGGKFFRGEGDSGLIERKKAEIEKLEAVLEKQQQAELQRETGKNQLLNQSAAQGAREREALEAAHRARLREIHKEEDELAFLEYTVASEELIQAKKNEIELLKQLDDEHYQGNRDLLLTKLEDAKSINSEETAARAAVNQEVLEQQKKTNSTFLKEQIKYGTAVATIDQALNSNRVNAAATVSGELVQLQNSNNQTLKSIGKAAAIAQISIDTARSAMSVFRGSVEAFGVPVGPIVGAALATAAIAYGFEQVGKVQAAADGGLIVGRGTGTSDSIPTMLSNGELVVPERNFDEVVGAVSNQRDGSGGGGGGTATVILELKDDLMDFIEAKLVERERLGISIQGA